jgi:hypothetical protein
MAASIRSGRSARSSDPEHTRRELLRALRELKPVVDRFVDVAMDDTAERELAAFVERQLGDEKG